MRRKPRCTDSGVKETPVTSSASTMDTSGTSVWDIAEGDMSGGEALSSMTSVEENEGKAMLRGGLYRDKREKMVVGGGDYTI